MRGIAVIIYSVDHNPTNQAVYLGRLYLASKVYFNEVLIGESYSFKKTGRALGNERLYSIPMIYGEATIIC